MTAQAQAQARYGALEWVMLVLSGLVFIFSSYFYFSDFALRKFFIPGWREETFAERVGHLSTSVGAIRRQTSQQLEFRKISKGAVLFDLDTVVTGQDGYALITLDDGGQLELGPNTMIRLEFGNQVMMSGITRSANIEVVTGQVSGLSARSNVVLKSGSKTVALNKGAANLSVSNPGVPKPIAIIQPKPLPKPKEQTLPPAEVRLISPRSDQILRVEAGVQNPKRPLSIEWATSRQGQPVKLTLKRGTELVSQAQLTPTGLFGLYETVLNAPGEYEVAFEGSDPRLPVQARTAKFRVDPNVTGITTLPSLVGGQKITSNEYTGEELHDFDILLRWKPYPGIQEYKLKLYRGEDPNKPILERMIRGTQYPFNKNKIFSGKVYFKVEGKLKSGFIVSSVPQPFAFSFLPPMLAKPLDQAVFRREVIAQAGDSMLMTWQKTNFTTSYQIEISASRDFKDVALQETTSENFYIWRRPQPGTWWWRVTSRAKALSSGPSRPFQIVIVP